ncbi:MAG: tetratricopeptide repeat protein, partial [Planctomycetota bacterium]
MNRILALALSLCGLLNLACTGWPEGSTEPSPTARGLFARARALSAAGETEGAEEALRRAIVDSPHYVEAHRAYQNLLDSSYRGHETQEIYRLFLDKFPDTGELHYLLGRITQDPAEQARLFGKAVHNDPDGFWPNLGMGYVLLQERSFGAACAYFGKALEARPRSAKGWRFLAEAQVSLRKFDEAIDSLTRAALFDPHDLSHAYRSARILSMIGETEKAFEILLGVLEREESPSFGPRILLRRILRDEIEDTKLVRSMEVESARFTENRDSAPVLTFGGHLAGRARDWETAEFLLSAALDSGAPPSAVVRDLRLALFAMGQYTRALEVWERKVPPALWREKGNEVSDRYHAVYAAVKGTQGGELEARFRLGRALLDCGWIREGVVVLEACAASGHPLALQDAARGRRHINFVRRLRKSLRGEYRRRLKRQSTGDLSDVLAEISEISLEILGEDLGKGNTVRSFAFIGEVLEDGKQVPSPLLRYFEKYNQVLILGKKAGSTPEAVLMTALYRNRAR